MLLLNEKVSQRKIFYITFMLIPYLILHQSKQHNLNKLCSYSNSYCNNYIFLVCTYLILHQHNGLIAKLNGDIIRTAVIVDSLYP